ncbi:MAG: GNAT family N-acetyltransferase [Pseudonocardia sp.]
MDSLDDLVGRRVTVRHRLRSGLLTDAVGDLSVDGGEFAVQTRRGPVRVSRADVVAVRAIPPPVPRRPSWAAVARLENVCADAWPARVDRPLGAWRLRAAGGFTGRANAALAVGDPEIPVPAALEAARAFAAEYGVPPRVHVPMGSPWDRAVAAAGWVLDARHEAGAEVAVLVADVERLAATGSRSGAPFAADGDRRSVDGRGQPGRSRRPDDDHGGEPVVVTERPDDPWWALALGREPTPDERWVLDPPPGPARGLRTAFGLIPGAGVIRAAVVGDHLHLSRLAVVPTARRAGAGTALTAAAAAWGREHGSRWAVLQVALQNTAARALYDALGATEHHRYRYLVPP